MRLALYQPDIAQNVGALLRVGACLGVGVDLIGPYGFTLSDRALRRAGMDYLDRAARREHASWQAFLEQRPAGARLVLLTTGGDTPYTRFVFRTGDTLLLGRESTGVPVDVHQTADARLVIPMAQGARSLNVAVAGAIVLSEALRQTDSFPPPEVTL